DRLERADLKIGHYRYFVASAIFITKQKLERDAEAGRDAAGRADGGAGEEAGKVDDVETVGDVGGLNLELQRAGFLAIELRAHAEIHGKIWFHAVFREIHAGDDVGAVLRDQDRGRGIFAEVGGQPAAVLSAGGE